MKTNTVFSEEIILRNILLVLETILKTLHSSDTYYMQVSQLIKEWWTQFPLSITLAFVSTCSSYMHLFENTFSKQLTAWVPVNEDIEFPGRTTALLEEQVVQVERRIVYVINVNITNCVVSGEDSKPRPLFTPKCYYMY
jgi:hypothetical protein